MKQIFHKPLMIIKEENYLFNKLKDNSQNYSKSQRVLAKFILTSYQRVAFTTIRQLSQLTGVSEATIVRFTKLLGLNGYPAFQKEIRRLVRADLKGNERIRVAYESKEGKNNSLSRIISKEIENLSYLQNNFDDKEFKRAVSAIQHARDILIVGTRSSASLAYHFWFGLTKMGLNATRINHITTETYDYLNRLDHNALIIVIGFPRYLRELKETLTFTKAKGLKTMAITDSPFSSLIGEINLYSPAESISFMAFHCAPMVLINSILIAISETDEKKVFDALSDFEKLAETLVYFSK